MTSKAQRRRRERRSEIRERILDSARSLFALEGYRAVTMRRLGERCRYTPSAIYKHFANKDAILEELRRDGLSRLALEMTEGIESVADRFGSPLAAMREAARRYLAFASGNPETYSLIFGGAGVGPEPSASAESQRLTEAFAELVARARGAEQMEALDRDLARVLWHALHGRALAPRAPADEDLSFVDRCVSMVQLAWLAEPRRSAG